MRRRHFIGIDVHCQFCEAAVIGADGSAIERTRCATSIPALAEFLAKVPRPRAVVIEEGPLADWLWRNLRSCVEELVVCNPRRNRLIARDGDKDDPLDAAKLAQLYRGGYVKAVHHGDSLGRSVLKQHVGLYHDRVRHRVAEALRVISLLRRHGVFVREKAFARAADRAVLLKRLPANGVLRWDVRLLWQGYDMAVRQEELMRRRLIRVARKEDAIRRFTALPGIARVRAATLFVWLDTPWRFGSKSALCKYLGIGLERRHSGCGPERLRVPAAVNRRLKCTILSAARSAIAAGDNPFADAYRRWIDQGLAPKVARRNVARRLATTLWGLWKNGSAYRPEQVAGFQAS
jgi:transposase